MGFTPVTADPCLYTKKTQTGTLIAAVHVDDILLSSTSKFHQRWFEKKLEERFELTKQYDNLSYLGLNVVKKNNGLLVTQDKHIQELSKKYEFDKLSTYPSTPTGTNFLINDPDSPPVDRTKYLSVIMSLMYIGRFTRPEILFAVSILSTKCNNPTVDDYLKALRIVKYLAGTPAVGVSYTKNRRLDAELHVDASHLLHQSGHGHGGTMILLGGCLVYCRSFKLKTLTRSSSESELVTLDDSVTYALWFKLLLTGLARAPLKPITIHQDNKSTVIMASSGGTFRRSKHLIGKYGFIQENITAGHITLKYCPSDLMLADMLTKPLSGPKLAKLLQKLQIRK